MSNYQPSLKPDAPREIIQAQIAKELLRQAKWSFNIFLGCTAISAAIGLTGVTLVLSGKLSEGSLTAVSGAIGTTALARLARQCSDRLNNQRQQDDRDRADDPDQ
jgi:hypothetical protein